MEFFLMDELECDLTIFHPYRTLLSLCCKRNGQQIAGVEAEAGEYGVVTEESGGHLWGASGGRLELDEAVIQHAW
jgi:cyclin C